MTDEPENLTPAFLPRLDAKTDAVLRTLDGHGERLSAIELSIGRLRRDQGSDAEAVATVNIRVDRVRKDLERIKRRLDLSPSDPIVTPPSHHG